MNSKLVLFAEDSPQDADMILHALAEHSGLNEIVVVNDGEKALEFLFRRGSYENRETGEPALVVLDVKMPKVDGLEVLRAIRADEKLRLTPVVMLTSSREERDVLCSYRLGSNAYIVKPVDFQSFNEAVKQLGSYWIVHNERCPALR